MIGYRDTTGTLDRAIRLDARAASVGVCDREASDEVALGLGVRLVGRAGAELGARDETVVVGDVRCDEPVQRGDRVEVVEVEPLVLQLLPEGLDHGVREVDRSLGDAVVGAGGEVGVLADDEYPLHDPV